jgi:RNA polymerase sigma-32 factor
MMRSIKNSKTEAGPTVEIMPASQDAPEDGEDVFDSLDIPPEDSLAADDFSGTSLPVPTASRLPKLAGEKDSLYLYLHEVSRFPLLTPEEEHEMALRVRDHNDPDAAFRLVSSHLRLVVRIAMDFQRRWMQNVLDLVQEGNVGLVRAVNKFDPDKGIKFSYYASFWIKAYILKFIMDNWRMVKIGTTQAQRKLFYNLNRERQKLIAQGYNPDNAALSKKFGVSEDQIVEMDQRLSSADVSLDAQVGDEPGATRMDFLPALEPGIEHRLASDEISGIVRERLKAIIPELNEKELYILHNRLLTDEPVTLREIGERYNITRERVRQLEARLLEKIHEHLAGNITDFSDAWIQT